eukprot:2317345-Amphidinium_carterae.1
MACHPGERAPVTEKPPKEIAFNIDRPQGMSTGFNCPPRVHCSSAHGSCPRLSVHLAHKQATAQQDL